MAFTRLVKKNNRGHAPGWHKGGFVKNNQGDIVPETNCPCMGKPQRVSKQLEARRAHFDANKLGDVRGFHRPGSQNRKK